MKKHDNPSLKPIDEREPKKGSDNVENSGRWFGGRNVFRVVSKKGKRMSK